jgi:non-specific serine/threonine protein kinase
MISIDILKKLSKREMFDIIENERGNFFKQEPYHHQLVALLYCYYNDMAPLFLEMGLGKSKISIDWLRLLGINNGILIVTVNEPLCYNWAEEIEKNSDYSYNILLGSKDTRIEILQQLSDIYIINYEGLSVIIEYLHNITWNAMLMDESRRIKNLNANRTRYSLILGKKTKYKGVLSGTPIINPSDIYPQFFFLDNGKIFGNTYSAFKKRFLIKDERTNAWILDPMKADDYIDTVIDNSVWFTKDECLDLPDKVYQVIHIKLTSDQMGDYEKLKRNRTDLNIAKLTSDMLDHKFIKYSQITGGFLKINDQYTQYVKNHKMEVLIDIIEEAMDYTKIVVFHRFIFEGRMIETELKKRNIKFSSLRGETKNKKDQYDSFRNDNKVRVIVAHPKSGGIGLNFTVSSVVVIYSMDYNIEDMLQAMERTHRIGQTKKVTYYYLICINTIDEQVKAAYDSGQSLLNRIKTEKLTYDQIVEGEEKWIQ